MDFDSYGTPKFKPAICLLGTASTYPEMTTLPWWYSQDLPPIQGLDVDSTWARQALQVLALKTGKTCWTMDQSGKPSIGYEELISLVASKLGGTAVHVELRDHKNEEIFFVWENASIGCWYRDGMNSLTFNIASLDKAFLDEIETFISTIISKTQPDGRA